MWQLQSWIGFWYMRSQPTDLSSLFVLVSSTKEASRLRRGASDKEIPWTDVTMDTERAIRKNLRPTKHLVHRLHDPKADLLMAFHCSLLDQWPRSLIFRPCAFMHVGMAGRKPINFPLKVAPRPDQSDICERTKESHPIVKRSLSGFSVYRSSTRIPNGGRSLPTQ